MDLHQAWHDSLTQIQIMQGVSTAESPQQEAYSFYIEDRMEESSSEVCFEIHDSFGVYSS